MHKQIGLSVHVAELSRSPPLVNLFLFKQIKNLFKQITICSNKLFNLFEHIVNLFKQITICSNKLAICLNK